MIKKNNVLVFIPARSIFLQGLIFMDKKIRNKKFFKWRKFLDNFDSIVEENKTKHYQVAFNYIYNNPKVDAIIFGVENTNQLLEIIKCKKKSKIYKKYKCEIKDEIFLNPFNLYKI